MNETPIEYTVEPLKTINQACAEACRMATAMSAPVWFDFNGTRIDVIPGMRPSDAVDQYFSKRQTPQPHTMTDSQKRKAALDAVEECRIYARDRATIIADDAALLLNAAGHSAWIYPELAEYIELRNTADKLMREVLP